jgi:hypothetical protein
MFRAVAPFFRMIKPSHTGLTMKGAVGVALVTVTALAR